MAFRQSHIEDLTAMDRATSRTICDAVGERLRQSLPPESSDLPSSLQGLLEELRRREH